MIVAAKATYDRSEQVRLYRQAQQEIAAQQPYLFLWTSNTYDVVRSEVSTVDGPLDLTAPNWAWQPERLVVDGGGAVMRSTSRARGLALLLVAVLATGCGTAPTPSPPASGSPAGAAPAGTAGQGPAAPAPTPVRRQTASPATPGYDDTLTIGWSCTQTLPLEPCDLPGYRAAAVGGWIGDAWLLPWIVVFSGLYRYESTFAAVPDLADGPCVPQDDGIVIRCRVIETTFHDGTPVTADDVAYSYRLEQRFWAGWPDNLTDVRVVDPHTVDFILKAADPLFVTEYLAVFRILSRNAVEADYASFLASTKGLASTDLTKLADAIDEEVAADPPVCTRRLDDVSALLAKLRGAAVSRGLRLRHGRHVRPVRVDANRELLHPPGCDRARIDRPRCRGRGLHVLLHELAPGRHRAVPSRSEAVDRVHLEAWPGYHGGIAATRYLDFVPARADGSDVVDGTVDILQTAVSPTLPAGARPQTVRVVARPGTQFNALVFNVRAGHAFADVNLRKALQLCIDLPRDVDVVSRGDGTPVYGPVPPGTWAFDEALPGPARDTAAARALIEGAGWRLGADGIYAKDGVRLAARIVARGEFDYRVKMADLIGLQARDCGMDLRTIAATWDDIMTMVSTYPHVIPGTNTPFDLYIGGFSSDVDPAPVIGMLVSSAISDAAHPDGANFGGFTDPALDRLVAAAGSTYDQAERARLYRQAQEELASQLPWLWLWAVNDFRVARTAVASVDGPVDLTAINWSWQPERLVVAKGAQ